MRDTLEITDELVRMQQAVDTAFAALGEWDGEERPDAPPSQWSAERRAEWEARWETYRRAVRDLGAHPVMRRAAAERIYGRMQSALRQAARRS
ncbi:hypothetical protein K7472_21190 [Streptomyces sp. PTM05]|uniref:Uncharacterized protein n=1 Tax=Streptantibioticus parmotrematis TaxID=2873249 RepID=A0ABS7QVU3_9ACTN|nr:hypothetical protein [Streptantibioticus parmotrematis]MBY8887335.1 hypothetical protein [Streptantibioticus parmotrematis]